MKKRNGLRWSASGLCMSMNWSSYEEGCLLRNRTVVVGTGFLSTRPVLNSDWDSGPKRGRGTGPLLHVHSICSTLYLTWVRCSMEKSRHYLKKNYIKRECYSLRTIWHDLIFVFIFWEKWQLPIYIHLFKVVHVRSCPILVCMAFGFE